MKYKRYSSFIYKLKREQNPKTLNVFSIVLIAMLILLPTVKAGATTVSKVTIPFVYTFSSDGVLNESATADQSGSPYWWVSSGGQLVVKSGTGQSLQGNIPPSNKWNLAYAKSNPIETDNGSHPQNLFSMFARTKILDSDQSTSVKINQDNLTNFANRNPWNGVFLVSRWQDNNNFYYSGIRADGHAIIKKKINGVYKTLSETTLLSGTWDAKSNPDLIPQNTWIKIRNVTYTDSNGLTHIQLYTDLNLSGNWKLVADVTDNTTSIKSPGLSGIRSDFMDVEIDNYSLTTVTGSTTPVIPPIITSTTTPITPQTTNLLFSDSFSQYPDGLITNEYAFWNTTDSKSIQSANWQMDSGSLFAIGGMGWTGIPNDISPNPLSTNGNDSSVFRLVTRQSNFGDVSVNFDLLNQGLNSSPSTPAVSWDGVHIFLRYQSEYNLYYASVNRRDNTVIIKKKVPGGPSNNGTYYELSRYVAHSVPYNTWQNITATVKNNSDGTVTISLYAEGKLISSAVDNGTIGGQPIRSAGKVGIRGDNANLKIKNFTVKSI